MVERAHPPRRRNRGLAARLTYSPSWPGGICVWTIVDLLHETASRMNTSSYRRPRPPGTPGLRALGWLLGSLLAFQFSAPVAAASESEDEYQAVLHATVDTAHGKILFETCARCHGANGAGQIDGSVPAIAGQHFHVIARQLVDYRHDERWDVRMEHFADFPYLIFSQDVADVAGYITALERAGPRASGDASSLDHGVSLYAKRCASCHGSRAEGNDAKGFPRLAGQHYPYLVRQLHDALEGRRPNFSRAHVRLLARFDRDDIDGVADYLSRLPP